MANPEHPEIDTTRTARILGLSVRQVQRMFNAGEFRTAYRPGYGSKAWWKVNKSEVLERRHIKAVQPLINPQ